MFQSHPHVTAVASERSIWQKCRLQVTPKHTCVRRMLLCRKWHHVVNTCMVAEYTQNVRRDGSSCMWHQPFNIQPCCAVSTPLRWIFKTALQSLIQNYMRQERRESARKQRIALYKSDQQQQSLCDLCAAAGPGSQEEANSVEAANSRNMLLLCDITVKCLCSYVPSHCLRRQTKECILLQLLRRPGHSYTLMDYVPLSLSWAPATLWRAWVASLLPYFGWNSKWQLP